MSIDDLLNVIGTSTGLKLGGVDLNAPSLTPVTRTAPIDARSLREALPDLNLEASQLEPYLKLMVMAVYADDNKDEDEVRLLDALRRGTRTLTDGDRSHIDLGALFEWAQGALSGSVEELQAEMKAVTAPFSAEQRPDLYTHVLVLLMLDSLKTEEVLFARVVGDALQLSQAERQRLTEAASELVPHR